MTEPNKRQAWASQRQQTFGASKQGSVEYEEVEVTLCEKLKREIKNRLIIWIIVLILLALAIRDSTVIIVDFLGNPKTSDMSMIANTSMAMPNLTFCMPKSIVLGHLKPNMNLSTEEWNAKVQAQFDKRVTKEEFLGPGWTHEMYMEAYNVISNINSLERETHPKKIARVINRFATDERLKLTVNDITKWLNEVKKRNITFQEFQDKVGIGVLSMSLVSFERLTYDEDQEVIPTGIKISWLSLMQMCIQPVFYVDKNISDQGHFFKFQLKHDNVTLYEQAHDCMSVDFHGRPSSQARFLEKAGSAKDGLSESLCISQKSDITVEVRSVNDMLETEDPGVECIKRTDPEDWGQLKESEFDCRSRCRMALIEKLCNCTGLTLLYLQSPAKLKSAPLCDYSKCMVDAEANSVNDTEKACSEKCHKDCKQVRYEVDFQDEGTMVDKESTLVVLNWGAFEYLQFKQKWVWSGSTLIGALGGAVGLWLGASIMTLITGIELITILMTKEVKYKRRENRMRRQQTLDHGDGDHNINNASKKASTVDGDNGAKYPGR